jgi:hypothetical protein
MDVAELLQPAVALPAIGIAVEVREPTGLGRCRMLPLAFYRTRRSREGETLQRLADAPDGKSMAKVGGRKPSHGSDTYRDAHLS